MNFNYFGNILPKNNQKKNSKYFILKKYNRIEVVLDVLFFRLA